LFTSILHTRTHSHALFFLSLSHTPNRMHLLLWELCVTRPPLLPHAELFFPLNIPLSLTHTCTHTHTLYIPLFFMSLFLLFVVVYDILIYLMHNFKRLCICIKLFTTLTNRFHRNSIFFVFHSVFKTSSIFLCLFSVRSKSLNIFSVLSQEINLWHSRNSDVKLLVKKKIKIVF